MKYNTSQIKEYIFKRIENNIDAYRAEFLENKSKVGTKFLAIDDLFPETFAMEIFKSFKPDSKEWREMKSFRETKMTSKQFDAFPTILGEVTFGFQEMDVVNLFSKITNIKEQQGDAGLYAGGLSMMRTSDFLNPHIDNSHDRDRKIYRRLNLLYYATPNWELEDGGHLELWDDQVRNKVLIESKFNRLVLMETHHRSWHSVNKVVKPNSKRCCVSNYYFSPVSPSGDSYFHITSFKGRPDQPFKRIISDIDTVLRNLVRKFKKTGLGKDDIYRFDK